MKIIHTYILIFARPNNPMLLTEGHNGQNQRARPANSIVFRLCALFFVSQIPISLHGANEKPRVRGFSKTHLETIAKKKRFADPYRKPHNQNKTTFLTEDGSRVERHREFFKEKSMTRFLDRKYDPISHHLIGMNVFLEFAFDYDKIKFRMNINDHGKRTVTYAIDEKPEASIEFDTTLQNPLPLTVGDKEFLIRDNIIEPLFKTASPRSKQQHRLSKKCIITPYERELEKQRIYSGQYLRAKTTAALQLNRKPWK